MKKFITVMATALMATVGLSDIVTNAVDVYDVTVAVRTPVVKLANATRSTPAYVYREVESRTLKGYLTLTWIQDDGDDYESLEPTLVLSDKKDGNVPVEYRIVDADVNEFGALPFDFSIIGKTMNKSAAHFVGVNDDVDGDNHGFKFLEFSGFGTTSSYKISIPGGCCGVLIPGNGKCTRIATLTGKVTGMYSTGCGTDSPSKMAQSCGYIPGEDGATALVGCDGTWTAKFNKKLSH